MNNRQYPQLVVDLAKLYHNAKYVVKQCAEKGIKVAGVIKGVNGMPECAKQFALAGCSQLASSRLEHLAACRRAGINTELMLIRIPMLSEAEDVVRFSDISLNSDITVLHELDRQAGIADKVHKVVLMVDLGDLREGFWGVDELVEAALVVDKMLPNLELSGIGTNLGCYGAIESTVEKMEELVAQAEAVEAAIGRTLDIISGGNTFTYPRLLNDDMPRRINHMRIGENILLARDLQDLWKYDMSHMYQDAFVLRAEIIEVRKKPSHPVGQIMFNTLGERPEYVDRGERLRAIAGIGKVDFVYEDQLIPVDPDIEILGASSDHMILDIEDCGSGYKVGDIVEFQMFYGPLVYVTKAEDVNIVFV